MHDELLPPLHAQEIGGVRFLRAPEFFWPLINKSDGTDSELGSFLAERVKGLSHQLERILFGGVSAEDWVTMGVGHMQVGHGQIQVLLSSSNIISTSTKNLASFIR